jgi:hypothetical protein
MWGNTTGWTLSAILLFLLAMTLHALIQMGNISPPTPFATDPTTLGEFNLTTSPTAVLPMTDPTDATPQYQSALADVMANRDAYRNAASSTNVQDIASLPAIQSLLAATHAHSASIFTNDPRAVITFDQTPKLDAINSLGHLLARAGLLAQTENPASAIGYFEAEFALGDRLYTERLTALEFTSGLELLAESAAGLSRALSKSNQPDRAATVRQFDTDRLHYYNDQIVPMLKVIRSIDPTTVANHAGDIFYIADHAKERMWRIEAIFALGRMRYFVGDNGRPGDQRGASRTLKKLEQSPDPMISLAATQASELTLEQYRAQH